MRVTILAFGIAKDIFGNSTITVPLPGPATVENLRGQLEEQYPRLKALASFMIAVNNEYASPDNILLQDDEIAVIPPVSGG